MAGLLSIFSLLSGILILRENPTAFDIGGVMVVVTGVYLLSFGQRKYTDKNQASWLGFKGVFLLSVVCAFWVSGLTVQGYASAGDGHADPEPHQAFRGLYFL